MTMDVPIVLVGEAPALKTKGRMLSRGITELPIECLPEKVPPQIEIDVSTLEELEQAIQVKDIFLDPDITVQVDPEQMVVKVAEVMIEVEPEPEVAEEEEVEGEEVEAEEGAEKPTAEAPEEKPEKSEKED